LKIISKFSYNTSYEKKDEYMFDNANCVESNVNYLEPHRLYSKGYIKRGHFHSKTHR